MFLKARLALSKLLSFHFMFRKNLVVIIRLFLTITDFLRKLGLRNEKYFFLNLNLNSLFWVCVLKKLNFDKINMPRLWIIKVVEPLTEILKYFLGRTSVKG